MELKSIIWLVKQKCELIQIFKLRIKTNGLGHFWQQKNNRLIHVLRITLIKRINIDFALVEALMSVLSKLNSDVFHNNDHGYGRLR